MRISGLSLYTETAHASSARVIHTYSTSFGLASRLLTRQGRRQIADIYALVRVADEIVDGPAAEAGMSTAQKREVLDALESETLRAMDLGFSANLIVHAFAVTARDCGIQAALVRPFFASMRMDLDENPHFDDQLYRAYIHGSAEVIGLMCLRVFVQEVPGFRIDEELEEGARRLGAAFQKVNFLRDLGADCDQLGRSYLPGFDPATFNDEDRNRVAEEITEDLRIANAAIRRLPPRARRATAAAAGLFGRLNQELCAVPATQLRERRVSVSSAAKARVLLGAFIGQPRP